MEQRGLELLRPLGQGGFGTVWLARLRGRDGFTRRVAVKLMKEAGAPADVVARQRDEARLLGLLQHPNIVQVYDLTAHDGLPAVVMEFVEGVDLSTMIRHTGALPLPCAVEVASGIAAALHAGWSSASAETGRPLRVIHRDIKPANVLLTVHGVVKVLDFGVARADFDREGRTQSMAFGTPRFMAPEQFLGGELTPANDVYALGVTLWELTQGRAWERPALAELPFVAKVEEQVALAPAALQPLLTSMLAWSPEARPTAQAVGEVLDGLSLPGERLRAWAARTVPGVMATHAAKLSDHFLAQGASPPSPIAAASAQLAADSGSSLPLPAPDPTAAAPSPVRRRAWPVLLGVGAAVVCAVLGLGGLGLAAWRVLGQAAGTSAEVAAPTNEAPSASAGGSLTAGEAPANPSGTPIAAGTPDAAAAEPGPLPASALGSAPETAGPSAPPRGGRPAPAADDSARVDLVRSLGSAPGPAASASSGGSPGGAAASPAAAPKEPAPAEVLPRPVAEGPAASSAAAAPAPGPAASSSPAETPAKTHTLRILADVIGATVRIDGTVVGTTPLPARPLSLGDHVIQVSWQDSLAQRTITLDKNSAGVLRYLSKEKRWVWE